MRTVYSISPLYIPLDQAPLAAAANGRAWLVELLQQLVMRQAILPHDLNPLQHLAEHASDADLDALRHAFAHGSTKLPEALWPELDRLTLAEQWLPSESTIAFANHMREAGGYVGEDDQGRLIWTLPGGDVDVLREADGTPVTGTRN